MVVEALKQIESRLNEKYEELLQTPAMVGEQGPKGPAGRDGKDGLNGRDGVNGVDGKDGKDGVDGSDGISVVDARVDFDGGLVITLSDGSEIDAGQIFSPEVAQNIQIFKGGGGGTSLPNQAGNSGKYLTTDGSALAWGTVSGGGSGTVTSVAMSVPTGLTVSGSPITTDGTLAVTYASGYAIPTTAKQTEWDTAFSWGNHASAGYLTSSSVLDSLADVVITTPTTGQVLKYNGTNWVNDTDATGGGSLLSAVTGTAPISVTTTLGTADVSISQATTSTNGYLSSTDWNTFNNKGSGTVTSVGLTAGTGISVSGSPITSSGSITVTNSAPMTYAGAGIAVSTGTAWGTSLTAPSGTIVGTTDTQTLTSKTLTDPTIIGAILEDIFTITDGAAFEIDPSNGTIQLITLGASRTPKATNFANGESVTLMVLDGTAYTITWTDATFGGSGVVWVGGSAPTLDITKYTVIELWKVGGQVYGALVGAA
jgi:hypothetical protein